MERCKGYFFLGKGKRKKRGWVSSPDVNIAGEEPSAAQVHDTDTVVCAPALSHFERELNVRAD